MTLSEILSTRGLSAGKHSDSDGPCCAVEAQALSRGMPITDNPVAVGVLDVRQLNDAPWWRDDAHRTKHLGPVLLVIDDWASWSAARQARFAELLAIGTVSRVLPIALRARGLVREADACEAVTTLDSEKAAWAAEVAGMGWAITGEADARAATKAAVKAAWNAADAAGWARGADRAAEVLETACDVWLRAAEGPR